MGKVFLEEVSRLDMPIYRIYKNDNLQNLQKGLSRKLQKLDENQNLQIVIPNDLKQKH